VARSAWESVDEGEFAHFVGQVLPGECVDVFAVVHILHHCHHIGVGRIIWLRVFNVVLTSLNFLFEPVKWIFLAKRAQIFKLSGVLLLRPHVIVKPSLVVFLHLDSPLAVKFLFFYLGQFVRLSNQ
jgi:hypothetical protein